MAKKNDPAESLREALRQSPDSLPLRKALAELLLNLGQPEEAEAEFREALANAPQNTELKFGLARAFFDQEKDSAALVIVEDLAKLRDTPAEASLLHCRLLVRRGDVERAVAMYKKAMEADSDLADAALAAKLGINAREGAEVSDGRLRSKRFDDDDDEAGTEVERPKSKFADVGGMDELKEEIRLKIIYPLMHPEIYAAYGKTVGGGILMYGPPGCGKTHLARATAGEIQASFLPVGINDVLDMWLGNSERQMHKLFEQARQSAPCVLFFDEVDALGGRRTDSKNSGGRHLINQFLAEMDGVSSSNEGVLVLAATNAPWHVDPAFRRPGRFDRILFVPPPDIPSRSGILRLHCRGKPMKDIDFELLGKKTKGFSGADLKAVVDVAVENKLREAVKTGIPTPLTTRDLQQSAAQLKPTTQEWFATARNYALYSNEGGVYDDVLKYLKTE